MPKHFSEQQIAAARDRFYPNWWIHRTADDDRDVSDMPAYRIVCRDEDERLLAIASKPHYLSADITVVTTSRVATTRA